MSQSWRAAELNADSCLSLRQILGSFGAPVSEEQAWAVVYEAAKCLDACLASKASAPMKSVTEAHHLMVHSEGFVHPSTFDTKATKRAGGALY